MQKDDESDEILQIEDIKIEMDAKTISVLEKLKPLDMEKVKENFRKKEEAT
jgi:hypothetical protein